jgi:hypothetical protein
MAVALQMFKPNLKHVGGKVMIYCGLGWLITVITVSLITTLMAQKKLQIRNLVM